MSNQVRQEKTTVGEKNLVIEQLKVEINRLKESNNNYSTNNQYTATIDDSNKLTSLENSKRLFDISMSQKHMAIEWVDILKVIRMTNEEIELLSKNAAFSKVIDGLELMNKVVIDKNMQIKVINSEIDNLNRKNAALSDENIKLFKKIINLKSNNQYEPEYTNVSMVYIIYIAQQHKYS